MQRPVVSICSALALALLAGCGGSDDSTLEVADSPAGAVIEAGSNDERKEALEVQDYFMRNCSLPGAFRKIPKKVREAPSDVADSTPGHELQDLDGETVIACPTG